MFTLLPKKDSRHASPAILATGERQHRELERSSTRVATGKRHAGFAIGSVDDPMEAEADRVAEQVLLSPQPFVASKRGLEPSHSSPGRGLDPKARAFFEPRFGFDFSKVQIHADPNAGQAAQSIGALAYTSGATISFANGRYQPETGEGRRLLAHELTHVVQQGQAPALPGTAPVSIPSCRATPAIQRDTPAGSTQQTGPVAAPSQNGPLAVTKQATMESAASRQEVTKVLTDFLYKAQAAQGGQTLHVTDDVRWAARKLFQEDPMGSAQLEAFLAGGALPGSAPEFAAAVTKLLPDAIPRSRMAHLGTQSPQAAPNTSPKSLGEAAGRVLVDSTVAPIVKKLPIPKAWQDKIIEAARGAVADGLVALVDQAMSDSPLSGADRGAIHGAVDALIKQKGGAPMDRKQDGAGSPYAPVQPPASAPPLGSVKAPGEQIFNLPKIPWDFPTRTLPKPNLPQAPAASDAAAVGKIIDALDDASLVPAAAKGKPNATNFAGAKALASALANLLAAADKKKQYTVELNISTEYRHVEDLPAIFDKISEIVHHVADALPGGAANVGEVIISPARTGKGDSFPARRIVKLHGGG